MTALVIAFSLFFLLCFSLIISIIFWKSLRQKSVIDDRIADLIKADLDGDSKQTSFLSYFSTLVARAVPAYKSYIELNQKLTSSGATEYLLEIGLLTSISILLIASIIFNLFAGIFAGIIVLLLTIYLLRNKRMKLLGLLNEQFPDTLDLMGRSLRAGHSLSTSFQMVYEESPEPTRSIFKRIYQNYAHGKSLVEVVDEFADLTKLDDVSFFATAIRVHVEAGGNLAEILDNLSDIIRERYSLKREVQAMTAEARLSAVVLTILPIFIFIGLAIQDTKYIDSFLSKPTGQKMLYLALSLLIIGALIIRSMVTFKDK